MGPAAGETHFTSPEDPISADETDPSAPYWHCVLESTNEEPERKERVPPLVGPEYGISAVSFGTSMKWKTVLDSE